MMTSRSWLLIFAFLAVALVPAASADLLVLESDRDNTLYESATGLRSNGSGPTFFSGRTRQTSDARRRGLVRFDLSGIPTASVVDSVCLELHVSRTPQPPATHLFTLHRLLEDWGEGTSDAGATGGAGVAPQPGDATWIHRFHPDVLWLLEGGDFTVTPSASALVTDVDFYKWGPAPIMTTDVQGWMDDPTGNFGWLLLGDEATPGSARVFDSRENVDPAVRPTLSVYYTPPVVGAVEQSSWGRIKALFH